MVFSVSHSHLEFLHVKSCTNAETCPMTLVCHFHLMCTTEIVPQCYPCILRRQYIGTQHKMLDELHIIPMGHIVGCQRHTKRSICKIFAQAKCQNERKGFFATIIV